MRLKTQKHEDPPDHFKARDLKMHFSFFSLFCAGHVMDTGQLKMYRSYKNCEYIFLSNLTLYHMNLMSNINICQISRRSNWSQCTCSMGPRTQKHEDRPGHFKDYAASLQSEDKISRTCSLLADHYWLTRGCDVGCNRFCLSMMTLLSCSHGKMSLGLT